jgi:hypothetical protein
MQLLLEECFSTEMGRAVTFKRVPGTDPRFNALFKLRDDAIREFLHWIAFGDFLAGAAE